MVLETIATIASRGQPWEGTRFRLVDSRDTMTVVDQNKKPILDEKGARIVKIKPGREALTVVFLGLTPDKQSIRYQIEGTDEVEETPISGSPYYAERLSGGRRRTRKTRRRRTQRKRF